METTFNRALESGGSRAERTLGWITGFPIHMVYCITWGFAFSFVVTEANMHIARCPLRERSATKLSHRQPDPVFKNQLLAKPYFQISGLILVGLEGLGLVIKKGTVAATKQIFDFRNTLAQGNDRLTWTSQPSKEDSCTNHSQFPK